MASSLDCIGFFTKTPEDMDLLMEITAGRDPKDLTTLPDYYNTSKPAFSSAGLEFLSTSYAGQPAEPPAVNEGVLASVSRSGARPAGPSPRAAGATPRFANLRTPLRQDTDTTPSMGGPGISENTTFNWDKFAEKVQSMNDAVYSQLMKTAHEMVGEVLHIYPEKKIVRTILSRDNNKRLLAEAAGGIKIEIHEAGEKPSNAEKDEVLSKISDIMGGEVQNDGGGNPFGE
jgi:hypothetical protein